MSLNPETGKTPFYDYGDASSIKNAVLPLVSSNCSDYAVAFSNYEMRPARQIGEVDLMIPMAKLGMHSFLRLHSYSWPHLVKGRSYGAMVVSAPRSGRTLSYLPPLCHTVCKTVQNLVRYPELREKFTGPMAVIVVANKEQVHNVSGLCFALLKQSCPRLDEFTLTLNVPPSGYTREFVLRLLAGVACLVVTAAQLDWVMHEYREDLRSGWTTRYLVLDNVDLMGETPVKMSREVLESFQVPGHKPQVVVVTEAFKPDLFAQLTSMNKHPALIFGDNLEAALYGGANFKITLTSRMNKIVDLFRLVRQRDPSTYRTVIFCDDDSEIREVVDMLEDFFYDYLPYYQNATLDDLKSIHRWKQQTRNEILLCTDQCPELNIRNAHTLIHYGMSRTWSKFKLRHLFLADNFKNGLLPEDGETDCLTLLSYAILDANNQKQLPRLVDFLQHHQTVDDSIVKLSKKIRIEMESIKGVLCQHLLIWGDCRNRDCEGRHRLKESDMRPPHLPASGQIKVILIKVYSPTHFCVRITDHKQPDGHWEEKMSPALFDMRVQLVPASETPRWWPPVAGDLCLYRAKNSQERVRILKVAPIQYPNLVQNDLVVEVQALDRDSRVFSTTSQHLYACPAALKREPPCCVDVRLLGLVPTHGALGWSEEEKHETEQWLLKEKKHLLMANIVMSTSHAIYVNDLVVMVYASHFKIFLQHLSVRQTLIKGRMARECERAKRSVLDFFSVDNFDDEFAGMPALVPIRRLYALPPSPDSSNCEEVGDGSNEEPAPVGAIDVKAEEVLLEQSGETGEVFEDQTEKLTSGSDEKPAPVGSIYEETADGPLFPEDEPWFSEGEVFYDAYPPLEDTDEEPAPVGAIDVKAEEVLLEESGETGEVFEDQKEKFVKAAEVLLAKDKVQEETLSDAAKDSLDVGIDEEACAPKATHAAEKEDTRADEGKKKAEEPGAVTVYDPQNVFVQFCECLKKCSEMRMEEVGFPKNPTTLKFVAADLFLKMKSGGEDLGSVYGPVARVENDMDVDYKAEFARFTTTLDPNVVHPQVVWHQTLFYVEFRFNIPLENFKYEVHVIKDQLLFQATSSDSPVVYQAILKLGYKFTEYSWMASGQNVHVRIGKAIGAMYPFNFSAYPCVRINHEKTAKQEEMMQERRNDLHRYLESVTKKKTAEEEFAEGEVAHEDSETEGVEGPSVDDQFSD
ncbi:putative ATP-dependent RNA helicase BoYb [Drosophila bipectinata]|uniref:putative ATP-dependent RNA helicase BoYb n=1 Tax=Drosophila bipectinata TaxID=42026 RepID=UPI001C894698|nr:putative ATP-dependent RNA helicase BoYb [Drosophila bipectinata]